MHNVGSEQVYKNGGGRRDPGQFSWDVAFGGCCCVFRGLVAGQTCSSLGTDIQDGGTYYIDLGSSAPFSFKSTFSGCTSSSVSPILMAPGGAQYSCSSIPVGPTEQESTWFVPCLSVLM